MSPCLADGGGNHAELAAPAGDAFLIAEDVHIQKTARGGTEPEIDHHDISPALAGLLGRCVRSGRLRDGTPGLKTGLDGGQDFADGGAIPHADAGAAHLFKLGGKGVSWPGSPRRSRACQSRQASVPSRKGIWLYLAFFGDFKHLRTGKEARAVLPEALHQITAGTYSISFANSG